MRSWFIIYQEELDKFYAFAGNRHDLCSRGYSTRNEAYLAGVKMFGKFGYQSY